MANVDLNIIFKVIGDGISALTKTTKAIEDAQKKADSVSGSFKRIGETAAGVFAGGLLTKGFELASGAAQSFVGTLGDAIKASSEQEDAINSLNIALASSGNYTKTASKEFQDFASELQNTTKFGDETVVKTGALIAQLTGLSGKSLKDATRATADLATALGKDLDSSATIVAKALSGQVDSLKRYGIEAKKGATDSETLSNVLGSLNRQFGGAAQGALNTYSGSLQSLTNAYGDVLEIIGDAITKNPVVTATFNAIKGVLVDLGKFLSLNSGSIAEFFGTAIVSATQFATVFIAVLDPIYRTVDGLIQTIRGIGINLGATAAAAVQAASGDFAQAFQTIQDGSAAADKGIKDAFSGDNALTSVGTALARIQQGAEAGFEALKNGATTSVEPTNAAKKAVVELSEAQKALIAQGVALANAGTQNGAAQYAAQLELQKQSLDQGLITQQEYFDISEQLRAEQYQAELEGLDAALAAKQITQDKYNAGQAAAAQKLTKDLTATEIARTKFEQDQQKVRAENFKSTLGVISTLQSSSVQEFFRIGQAAAIATATIDGFAAVQKALASAPPPFNFALAALVGVATASNIAKIASSKPPALATGLTEVPQGFSGDKFPAFLNSGERVVSAPQNQDLKAFMNESAGNREILQLIANKLDSLNHQTVVNIGGKEIVNVMNDEIAAGRSVRSA